MMVFIVAWKSARLTPTRRGMQEHWRNMEDSNDDNVLSNDPFSEQLVKQVQLIVLMRIYDVGMAILNELDEDVAKNLHLVHREGKIIGSLPYLDLSGDEDEDDEV